MTNYNEIKRKHFRFPAFSDDTGVKIQSEKKFPTFSDEENWILTEDTSSQPLYKSPQTEERSLRRSPKGSHEKAGQSIQQREELSRHRKNLPDYTKKYQSEVSATGKKQLFGESSAASSSKVSEKRADSTTDRSLKKEYSGRSYFVPKYIPASMIPDTPVREVSNDELLQSMKKDNYLLFDTEPAAYQERKDSDPAVQRFQKSEQVTMSRSQYREVSKTDKKRSVLDRSLAGMIEDGTTEGRAKGYFEK